MTGLEQQEFAHDLAFDLSKEQLNQLRIFIREQNKTYHLAELQKVTQKDILDNYKKIAEHTSYDYVKGAQYLLNTLINNATHQ
jgi:translation initiation factor 2 beta subunit (eIF-2beta)/eIF-5